VEVVPTVIIEHHMLRDDTWKQKATSIYQKAQVTEHRVVTAAEYIGEENFFLEFKRKQFYDDFPPSEEFKQWMKTLNKNKKIAETTNLRRKALFELSLGAFIASFVLVF